MTDPASSQMISEMASLVGLSNELTLKLISGEPLIGPTGLLCFLHQTKQNNRPAVFPEIAIPISAQELAGDDVVRLLGVQETLLREFGWRISMASIGLISICPLLSHLVPETLAIDLEKGQVIGRGVLQALVKTTDIGKSAT